MGYNRKYECFNRFYPTQMPQLTYSDSDLSPPELRASINRTNSSCASILILHLEVYTNNTTVFTIVFKKYNRRFTSILPL